MQWLAQKEIATNFLPSQDTILENNFLRSNNKRTAILKNWIEPGEVGYWITDKTYTIKNYIAQIIQLVPECHDYPVSSPFGILVNSNKNKFANFKISTIVWKRPNFTQKPECDMKIILTKTGTITNVTKQSKLEDLLSQIEMIIGNEG